REPLAIFDATGRLRYANRPAALLAGPDYVPGWQIPEAVPLIEWEQYETETEARAQARNCARNAYHDRKRTVRLVKPKTGRPNPCQTWLVLADAIEDEGATPPSSPLGVFLEGQNLSFLNGVFARLARLLHPDTLCPLPTSQSESSEPDPTDGLIDEVG